MEVVGAPESRGIVAAYVRGYREAIAPGHDDIREMEAGFSHRPEDLAGFLEAMDGGYDCIFGSRFVPGGSMTDSPWHRRLVSRGGTVLANLLLGTRLHDMTSGFELFSRLALSETLDRGIRSRAHFFPTEITYNARSMPLVHVPIPTPAPTPPVRSASTAA